MDGTVVIYIQAYNAECTLRRALESVLQQTYSNWVVYLVDNGSTDGTKEIAEDYARQDARIILKHVASNDIWYFYSFVEAYLKKPLGDYFAWLDADDAYKPEFLENSMSFIKKNRLGICVCGTDYIDASSGKTQLTKKPDADFVMSGRGFSERFLEYRRFTDTLWGKVYSFSLLKSVEYKQIPRIRFAPDSVAVLELFKKCYQSGMRIGFLAEPLHQYYRAPTTLSRCFSLEFADDFFIYHKVLTDYLKCFGKIGKLNGDYLSAIWLGWIQDFFTRVRNADIALPQKVTALNKLFSSPITTAMLRRKADPCFRNLAARREFCQSVGSWMRPYENDGECGLAVRNILAILKVE